MTDAQFWLTVINNSHTNETGKKGECCSRHSAQCRTNSDNLQEQIMPCCMVVQGAATLCKRTPKLHPESEVGAHLVWDSMGWPRILQDSTRKNKTKSDHARKYKVMCVDMTKH